MSGLAEGTALEQDRQLAHKLLDTAMDGPKADWKIPLTMQLPAQPGAARLLQHLANGCDRWEIFQKNTNTASALREWTGITGDPVGKEILGQMYEMGIRVRAVPIFAYLQAAVQRLALEVF